MRRWLVVVVLVLVAAGCRAPESEPGPLVPTTATADDRVGLAGLPWLTLDDRPKVSVRGAGPDESYNRARDWMPAGWTDPDGNGCDTREDALIRESLEPVTCVRGRVSPGGRWWRGYVSGQTSSASTLEIDHVVALADAWRSGGWRWPVERMRDYAQTQQVLWAVDGPANQAKSDKGPGEWRPDNALVHCLYAQRYVSIKATYDLTVTRADLDGLRDLLREC